MHTTLTQLSPATAVVGQWRQAVGGQIQALQPAHRRLNVAAARQADGRAVRLPRLAP